MITLQEVLIETLWNVKRIAIRSSFFACKVLIETLWNVKLQVRRTASGRLFVLIETLWNVKTNSRPVFRQAMRINRNIVECKGRSL